MVYHRTKALHAYRKVLERVAGAPVTKEVQIILQNEHVTSATTARPADTRLGVESPL